MTRSLEPITSWTTSGLFYKNYFSLPKISTQSTEGFGIGKGRFIHSKLNKRTLKSVAYGNRYRVGLGRILISIRISGIRPDIWLKPDVRHYKKISRISGIRIVLRILKMAGYLAKPDIRPNPSIEGCE